MSAGRRSQTAATGVSLCADRSQSRWRGEFFQNDIDLFAGDTISIVDALFPHVAQGDHSHCAEAVIKDDQCSGNYEHHLRQREIVARMNRCFPLKKSDHVVADKADRTALEMRNVVARNKAEFAENLLQFAERIGGAATGGGARFFANGHLALALAND